MQRQTLSLLMQLQSPRHSREAIMELLVREAVYISAHGLADDHFVQTCARLEASGVDTGLWLRCCLNSTSQMSLHKSCRDWGHCLQPAFVSTGYRLKTHFSPDQNLSLSLCAARSLHRVAGYFLSFWLHPLRACCGMAHLKLLCPELTPPS